MNKKNNIILVGMPGAGKTYIGEKLAQKLQGFTFVDTDKIIEQNMNMSITDIFNIHGEKVFREEETNAIKDIVKNTNQIIAIGGGAFNQKNIATLKQNGVTFYLKAPINLIYERIKNESTRPLLMNTDDVKLKLSKLLNERENLFEKANCIISQENIETEEIINKIIQQYKILKNSIDILSYPVFINSDDLNTLETRILEYSKGKCFIVIDENVEKIYGKHFRFAPKFVLKSGEKEKNIHNYEKIINFAIKNKIERNDTLIAIGGGVTGDLAGFAASTYLRGINLIHIPTTLLACVDSSIGGKTAINSKYGKNLIGSFYQPIAVFCNLNFLKTIDLKQYKTGLAEVLKYAFIEASCKASENYDLLELLEHSVERIFNRDHDIVQEIIKICIELKETVVLKDEKESNLRQILNFGHTYGHAIEINSKFKVTHGEAVAQGMIFAFELAIKNRLISEKYFNQGIELIKKYKLYTPLKTLTSKIIETMEHDKKAKNGKINFVLPYYPKAVEIIKLDPKTFQ